MKPGLNSALSHSSQENSARHIPQPARRYGEKTLSKRKTSKSIPFFPQHQPNHQRSCISSFSEMEFHPARWSRSMELAVLLIAGSNLYKQCD